MDDWETAEKLETQIEELQKKKQKSCKRPRDLEQEEQEAFQEWLAEKRARTGA